MKKMEKNVRWKKRINQWKVFMWKACLMRKANIMITLLELIVPIALSIQLRLMFDPLALNLQHVEVYMMNDVTNDFPKGAKLRYTPSTPFTDELMSRVSKRLNMPIPSATDEKELISSYFENHTQTNEKDNTLWIIFNVLENSAERPEVLNYTLRSTQIGSSHIVLNEDYSIEKDPYITSGYIALQTAIDRTYLQFWINDTSPRLAQRIKIGYFSANTYNLFFSPSMIRPNITTIYYIMILAFLVLPAATLHMVIHDKISGFRELLRVTNTSVFLLYLGWTFYMMLTTIPVLIICVLLLHPILMKTHFLEVALFIFMYIIMSSFFVFTINTTISGSMKPILIACILWLYLAHVAFVTEQTIIHWNIWWKVLSLLLPHTGLIYGLISMTSRLEFEIAIDHGNDTLRWFWPVYIMDPKIDGRMNFMRHEELISHSDKIPMVIIYIAWTMHILIWGSLTIYLDGRGLGRARRALLNYFWNKFYYIEDDDMSVELRGSTNWSAVEPTPRIFKPVIRLRKVTKKIGSLSTRITAVNDVTLDFYEKEFTVILGHNGAGKSTLLKLLTGLYVPSVGNIYIEVSEVTQDKSELVNVMGYCAQDNTLVNYMSALQHIYMLGMLKGLSYRRAVGRARWIMKQLQLSDVEKINVRTLPFGLQRQICLAMALIGKSKIIILDEPTYGADLEQKRLIWRLLTVMKRNSTVILATNSMDASEILADRIAIIVNGKIESYGSKSYLNKRFGVGYVLSVSYQEDCDLEELLKKLQAFASDRVTMRGTTGMIVRYNIPKHTRVTKLLQHLDENKKSLKINSVTITASAMEGQFLRIGLASQLKDRNIRFTRQYEIRSRAIRQSLIRSGTNWNRLTKTALLKQQIQAMFYKKILHIVSTWNLYLASAIVAIVSVVLATALTSTDATSFIRTAADELNVSEYTVNHFHMLYYAAKTKNTKDFLTVLSNTGQSYSKEKNYLISKQSATEVMMHPHKHSIEFRDRYFLSIDILPNLTTAIYSSTAIHGGPIAMNLINNALLNYHSGSQKFQIKLTSQPIIAPEFWKHRLVLPRNIRIWASSAIVASLCLLLPIVDMGMSEKKSISKQLQLNINGVNAIIYWMPAYTLDFFIYVVSFFVIGACFYAIYHAFIKLSVVIILNGVAIVAIYGLTAIPLVYCFQLFTKSFGLVYFLLIIINLASVIMLNISSILPTFIRRLPNVVKILIEFGFHLCPPYILGCTVATFASITLHNEHCKISNSCDNFRGLEDPCCQICENATRCFKPSNLFSSVQAGFAYNHSIITDICLLILQMLIFNYILLFVEQRKLTQKNQPSNSNISYSIYQEEAIDEKIKCDEIMNEYNETNKLPEDVLMVVSDLTKSQKQINKFSNINFVVRRQECFAILGMASEGKSDIFRVLTGQTDATSGNAILLNCGISDRPTFVGMIGYCPQRYGLNEYLTGRQNLRFYAAMRGIPPNKITDEVDRWLDIFDLLDYENMKIHHYSWGMQRKICLLQTLIGDPPIILLDEPSSGIDVMSRHTLCEVLHMVRNTGRSFVIASHGAQETDALCQRAAVLVGRQFCAVGSCEELKTMVDTNFIVVIRLKYDLHTNVAEEIKQVISQSIPEITLKHDDLGLFVYKMPKTTQQDVFKMLDAIRSRQPAIVDFSISPPSMSHVFSTFVQRNKPPRRNSSIDPGMFDRLLDYSESNAAQNSNNYILTF